MKFMWLGGPTFILEFNNFRIITDPMFGEGEKAFTMSGHPSTGEWNVPIRRNSPLPDFNSSDLDLILISHLHTDHFDPTARKKLNKNLKVISHPVHSLTLRNWGFINNLTLSWNEKTVIIKDDIQFEINAVIAKHAHEEELNKKMGIVNGYVLKIAENGLTKTLYWTGDTVYVEKLNKIKTDFPEIDVLIPHLGAVGSDGPFGRLTLDADETIELLKFFNPKLVIPIHHSTFGHYIEPIDILIKNYNKEDKNLLKVLKEGESTFI
jgi:L-ascorbate metabolism protein UlaG (beta-lactamase superfamily)